MWLMVNSRLGEMNTVRACAMVWMSLLANVMAVAKADERSSITTLMSQALAVTYFEEAAISPDHHGLAWVQSVPATEPGVSGSAIYFQALDRNSPAALVSAQQRAAAGAHASVENSLAWSPDSRSLAFLSDADSPGQLELYLYRVDDHSLRRVTNLKGTFATPHWSPDGLKVALLFTENSDRPAGPLVAVPAPTGVIEAEILEQALMLVDVGSGAVERLTSPDRYVYEFDWSPWGDSIVATGAHGSGDNNWYTAELFTIEIGSHRERVLLKPNMQIAVPRWAPDGKSIAFIGGLMSDESDASGDVYVIQNEGGPARNLTPTLPGSAFSINWSRDSRGIVISEARAGGSAVSLLDVRTGRLRSIWAGEETLRATRDLAFGVSLARDDSTSAVIRESFNSPPSLWIGKLGHWSLLKQSKSAELWGAAESVHWKSDGFDVQGWLIPPPHVDAGRTYPMIVFVHGGPAWLTAPSWPTSAENQREVLLAAQGYYVFYPNARGSAGFGERFTRANVKDLGEGPLRDILAGVDAVTVSHSVDYRRVGLTGWSYGGYMTMWALTQTSRFRAAVAGAGVADWLSYYGENGIDEGLIPYFGTSAYDDPEIYAKSSPITFIKQVRTPTLIVVGDSDVECPVPQSYEYWHALKTLGVKTQLVVYPHEGHEFSDSSHVLDLLQRMLAWFDQNMPAAP